MILRLHLSADSAVDPDQLGLIGTLRSMLDTGAPSPLLGVFVRQPPGRSSEVWRREALALDHSPVRFVDGNFGDELAAHGDFLNGYDVSDFGVGLAFLMRFESPDTFPSVP